MKREKKLNEIKEFLKYKYKVISNKELKEILSTYNSQRNKK